MSKPFHSWTDDLALAVACAVCGMLAIFIGCKLANTPFTISMCVSGALIGLLTAAGIWFIEAGK